MELTGPQSAILSSTQSLNLFMSGQGGGKTLCMGIRSRVFISNFPNVRGLIAANTDGQLNRSTMMRVQETWQHYGLEEYHAKRNPEGNYVVGVIPPTHFNTDNHYFVRYNNIISFANGAVVYIGSLENYKALDGMEIGWAMLDETKDTREVALREVIMGRLRQKGIYVKNGVMCDDPTGESLNPLYICTSPAKIPWLNDFFELDDWEPQIRKKIFDKDDYFNAKFKDKRVVIASTYTNIKNLPESYIRTQVDNQPSHLKDMLVYGCPFSKSGGEFYKQFDRETHVKRCVYDSELAVNISFDENYVPYAPSGVWQVEVIEGVTVLRKIKEIDLEEPHNNIYSLCTKYKELYKNHDNGVFIYGDATSKKGDAKIKRVGEDKPNFYSIIKKELSSLRPSFRVPASNPSVVSRALFINAIFEGLIPNVRIEIDKSCKNTIADYSFLKEDINGKKLKELVKNPITKQTYQKYGHDSDLDDYFICEVLKDKYAEFRKPTTRRDKPAIIKRDLNKVNRI